MSTGRNRSLIRNLMLRERLKKSKKAIFSRLQAQKEIVRMCNEEDGAFRLLAKALNNTLRSRVSSEEKIWMNKINLLRNELINSSQNELYTKSSMPHIWAFVLFRLIRTFKPSTCLELGTCLGISAAYQAAAIELNVKGRLVTVEKVNLLAELALNNFQKLNSKCVDLQVGESSQVLKRILPKLGSVDFVFIDDQHEGKVVLNNFEQILPFLADPAIVVFDDIRFFSEDMRRAWTAIKAYKEVKIIVDLAKIGICVLGGSLKKKKEYGFDLNWAAKPLFIN